MLLKALLLVLALIICDMMAVEDKNRVVEIYMGTEEQ